MKMKSIRPGTVDGGEGRGYPLSGHDRRPSTGYRALDDEDFEIIDRELFGNEEDSSERRRDPLRR